MNVTVKLVSVCAWCPDAKAQTEAIRAQGHEVTHGICPACYKRAFGEDYKHETDERDYA